MNKLYILLACFVMIGSLSAADLGTATTINASDYKDLASIKIADYSNVVYDKSLAVISTDTVTNRIDKAKNLLTDCDLFTCDLKVLIEPSKELALEKGFITGLTTDKRITFDKPFFHDTRLVEKTRPTYTDTVERQCRIPLNVLYNKSAEQKEVCQDVPVRKITGTETYHEAETYENTDLSVIKEPTTVILRAHKPDMKINTDLGFSIFGQERWDAAWWNTSCTTAFPIDINSTVASTLSDYPAMVSINTGNATLFNSTTCTNVRFLEATNTTLLDYDLDSSSAIFCGNATNNATYWVRVNATGAALTRIYLYACPIATASGENEKAVWGNASAISVWHYNDATDVMGTNNLTSSGTPTYVQNTTACKFGLCSRHEPGGYSSKSSATYPTGANPSTMSIWAHKTTSTNDYDAILSTGTATTNTLRVLYFAGQGDNPIIPSLRSDTWGTSRSWVATSEASLKALNHYGLGFDGSNTVVAFNALSNNTGAVTPNTASGNINLGTAPSLAAFSFTGVTYYDEARLYSTYKSTDWLKAEYAQFAIVGAQESNGGAPATGNLTVNATTGGTATGNNSTFTPPANLTINATASGGYYFIEWHTNCNGTVANTTNPNTKILVNDATSCFAEANFASATPIIQSSAILPAQVYQNDNMLGHCNATAADGSPVSYNFTWYKNGAVNTTGSVGTFTQGVTTNVGNISNASTAIGQNWTLQCLGYNANGASAALNSSVTTILNTTPSITSITITPASPTVISNLSCNLTVADAEHTTTNITGNWSKNGAVLLAFSYNNLANNTATIVANLTSGNFSKGDNISCSARAFDGIYYSGLSTSANKTILNSAPTTPLVNSFANASVGHSFTVNGSVTDADGGTDIATATITPSIGSCVQLSNSTSGTTFSVKYNCTSTVAGTANITIGFTDKSTAYTNSSAINAYPDHAASLAAPTLTPATIYTVTVVTCNMGVFSDIDSDTENVSARVYAWQYNGATAAGQTASTFNLSAYGANNSANVSCSIFSTNSTWASSNATTYSANKSITPNYAPVITTQNTFTNSTSGHSFTVFAGAVDNDAGDIIASTSITTTLGSCAYVSNSTIGGATNVTYLCTSTSSGSSAITIRFTDAIIGNFNTTTSTSNSYPDKAPTLSAPTITPTLAHLNDTLTCNPGVFSDVDGDTENVSARVWAWYVNGVYTAATQTLASGAFTTYDNITCTENSTNSSWTLTAQASSAVFTNVLGFFYTSYGNTSGVVGIGAAFDYSASAMTTATGNADAFGLLIMATVFIGFYIIGSRYTQERALVYATFVTTVVAFLLVSGNFLSPNWLILSIIALLAAIYFANRVG